MADSTQQNEILWKQFLGTANAQPGLKYIQEPPGSSRQNIIPDMQIFKNIIPSTAPKDLVTDLTFEDGTRKYSSKYPHIVKYEKLKLKEIQPGFSYYYKNSDKTKINKTNRLRQGIPFNYDPIGSYEYNVYDSDNNSIPPNSQTHPWVYDINSGYLTFYGSYPLSAPPTITFWRYEGEIGLDSGDVWSQFAAIADVNMGNKLINNCGGLTCSSIQVLSGGAKIMGTSVLSSISSNTISSGIGLFNTLSSNTISSGIGLFNTLTSNSTSSGEIQVVSGGANITNFVNIRAGINDSYCNGYGSQFIRTTSTGNKTIDYQVTGDKCGFGDLIWQDARYVYNNNNNGRSTVQVWGIVTSSNVTPVGPTMGDIHFYNSVYVDTNIGIGTINPEAKLDIKGGLIVTSTSVLSSISSNSISSGIGLFDILSSNIISSGIGLFDTLTSNSTSSGEIQVVSGGANITNFVNIRAGINDTNGINGHISKLIRTASSGTYTIDYQVANDTNGFGNNSWQDTRYVYNPANIPGVSQVWGIVTSSNVTPVGPTMGDIHFYKSVYVDTNIGIGTINPEAKLDIKGGLIVTSTSILSSINSNTITSGIVTVNTLSSNSISSGNGLFNTLSSNSISSGNGLFNTLSSNTISSGIGLFDTLTSNSTSSGEIQVVSGGANITNFVNIRAGINDSYCNGYGSQFIRTTSTGNKTADYQVTGDKCGFGDLIWQDARYVYNEKNNGPSTAQVWGIVTSSNVTPVGPTMGDIHFYKSVYVDTNIGIGTINPEAKLDIKGGLIVTSTSILSSITSNSISSGIVTVNTLSTNYISSGNVVNTILAGNGITISPSPGVGNVTISTIPTEIINVTTYSATSLLTTYLGKHVIIDTPVQSIQLNTLNELNTNQGNFITFINTTSDTVILYNDLNFVPIISNTLQTAIYFNKWIMPRYYNTPPQYIFINNALSALSYNYSNYIQYTKLDFILVGGGGGGGGGKDGSGPTSNYGGGGGGSGYLYSTFPYIGVNNEFSYNIPALSTTNTIILNPEVTTINISIGSGGARGGNEDEYGGTGGTTSITVNKGESIFATYSSIGGIGGKTGTIDDPGWGGKGYNGGGGASGGDGGGDGGGGEKILPNTGQDGSNAQDSSIAGNGGGDSKGLGFDCGTSSGNNAGGGGGGGTGIISPQAGGNGGCNGNFGTGGKPFTGGGGGGGTYKSNDYGNGGAGGNGYTILYFHN